MTCPAGSTADVSRETQRREVFGDHYDQAAAYEQILRTDGIERGLLGPREGGRIWDRHLLNCAVVAPCLPAGARLADVGSGAGLPGLVLAILRPDLDVVLVEPLLRRANFLTEVVARLGLAGVEIRRARAQGLGGDLQADVVTARAVAPLDRLAGWCLPLVRPGGALLALKGAQALEELTVAAPELTRLGAASWSVQILGSGIVDPPARVVRIVRAGDSKRPEPSRRRARR